MNTVDTAKATEIYNGLLDYLNGVKASVVGQEPVDIEQAYRLIETLIDDPALLQKIFPLTMKDTAEKDFRIPHQANAAVCALKLAPGLGYSRSQLLDLGVVSLIHDLGVWMIPKALLQRESDLTAAELDILREHSRFGMLILASFREERPWLPEVVYQHHERGNGTGYPRGLKLNEMHDYAKVLCFVDAYEAMSHHRPNRRALKQTFTTKELIAGSKQSAFPADVMKAFLKEITFYPEGCHVLLNNKCICEVVATNRNYPLKPDVKVIIDDAGREIGEARIIKLADTPLYQIMDCVSLDDMKKA